MFEEFIGADWWQDSLWSNPWENYGKVAFAFFAYLVLFSIIQRMLLKRFHKIVEKTPSTVDDVIIKTVETLRPPFYTFLAFYLATDYMILSALYQKTIYTLLIAWIVYQIILVTEVLLDYIIAKRVTSGKEKDVRLIKDILRKLSKAVLWTFGLLFILSNLGININSLIAGLGIGGIAIALALQSILRDLFSSFAIYFDKPFVIGDYIAVGEYEGFVQEIGVKTTRIKSTQGEEIIVSNQELTSAKIKNFSKLTQRRVAFNFKVDSKTSDKNISNMPASIKKMFDKIELARFEYLYLTNFNGEAYDYELAYLVESDKYQKFLKIRENVLQNLSDILKKEGVKIL